MSAFITRVTPFIPFLFVWMWSTGFLGAKYGLPYIEPFFMLSIRFVLTISIFLLLILVLKNKRLSPQQACQQMVIGMLLHGMYLGGNFYAMRNGLPAGIASIISGLQPIVTAAFGLLFLQQRLSKWQMTGLCMGFAGIIFVVLGGDQSTASESVTTVSTWQPYVACLIALAGISIATVLQKQWGGKQQAVLTGTLYQYIGGLIFILPLTWLFETQQYELTGELIFAIAWLVLVLSVGAILLLMLMIKQGEVAKVASYFYLVPVVVVVQSYFMFDERLSVLTIIGCVLAVFGVYLVLKKPSSKTATS